MILEVADILVTEGREAEFPAAVSRGLQAVIGRSGGYRSATLRQGIESPRRFVLLIEWDTLEDHTVGFRQSPLFAEWRAIVGPFFAEPPRVEHFTQVASGPAPGAAG